MDEDLIDVLDEFRSMKIRYDIERFKLLSFQIESILKDYELLINSRKDIQEKYFRLMNNLNENGFDLDIDYSRWDRLRLNENQEWKFELDEISALKCEVEEALELLKNGEIEKLIIEEEEKLTGDSVKKE